MLLVNKRFLKPTKDARVISILENLRINPEMSQSELGERSLLSSAMVNNYLGELQKRGFIKPVPLDGKRFRYELTSQGEEARRDLLGYYMAEIVQVYSALKQSIKEKLDRIVSEGIEEIVLFGASTTCEVVLSVIDVRELRVIAVIDSDIKKHGQIFCGYVISPPEILKYIKFNAILITSFARHKEIRLQLENNFNLNNVRIFTL